MTFDPIRPYLPIVALGLAVALLFGGCSWGKSLERDRTAKVIAKKDAALRDAAESLRAAAQILRNQELANQQRIRDAEDAAKAAEVARAAADRALAAAEARLAAHDRAQQAARRRPGCAELLDRDLEAVCGL